MQWSGSKEVIVKSLPLPPPGKPCSTTTSASVPYKALDAVLLIPGVISIVGADGGYGGYGGYGGFG